MNKVQRCEKFLVENGWALEPESTFGSDYTAFYKEGLVTVDINSSEIVLVGEIGDFCHLPVDYYTLIGALMEYRQIAVNYVPVKAV